MPMSHRHVKAILPPRKTPAGAGTRNKGEDTITTIAECCRAKTRHVDWWYFTKHGQAGLALLNKTVKNKIYT